MYRYSPAERISTQETLRIQTMGGSYAVFQEKEIGSIGKGELADLVVWDKDFYMVPQEEIKDIKAEGTILGGEMICKSI